MNLIRSISAFLILLSIAVCPPIKAQPQRITHQITHARHDAPELGRDCWFLLLTNYGPVNLAGKYFALYVTSPSTTTVYVQLTGGARTAIVVKPYQTTTFNMPLAWEMHSSGVVGDFGVHVWSNDADICAYVMSHSPATSDGMYVIPAIGWGKEYVVAAYAALNEGSGSTTVDLPSEFGIVANQDNTHVSITPTADIRVEASSGACCSCVLAAKGQTFQVILNRGESVQYETTCTLDCDNFDLTGTVITSDKLIGVEGGSQCTNIPCDFPYCDHVLDYIPPTRTWGSTYYSIPFYQPPGSASGHQASTFLVVSSKPGQIISRFDNLGGLLPVFTAFRKYDFRFLNDITQGTRWFSEAPFLLVQYINSASYPDRINGNGDPSEVVINSAEEFTKTAVFCTPSDIGSQGPYTSYVNIVTKYGDTSVRFDGKSVKSFHQVYMDGIYEGYRADAVTPGTHIVTSDSGVGVYIYGYGHDESYAWSGLLGMATVGSRDTTPPIANASGACYSAHINLSDADGDSASPGLDYIRIDSVYNMGYQLDPTWIEGVAKTASFYDMTVTNLTQPASLVASVFDMGGNRTTISSTYVPQTARIGPPIQYFANGNDSTCLYAFDTLVNTGQAQFPFSLLHLAHGDQGFSIDSAVMTPLSPGERRAIKICFKALTKSTVYDTILFGDVCVTQEVVLTGDGGLSDFSITGHSFGTTPLGTSISGFAQIINRSSGLPIVIDSTWVDDTIHFAPIIPQKYWAPPSYLMAPNEIDSVQFTFMTTLADTAGSYQTSWYALSKGIIHLGETGIRSNFLVANVVPAASVGPDADHTVGSPTVVSDGHFLHVVLPADWSGVTGFELETVLGINVLTKVLDQKRIDISSLPTGTYFYRLTGTKKTATGKLILEQ